MQGYSLQWFLKFKKLAKLDTSSAFWDFLRNWGKLELLTYPNKKLTLLKNLKILPKSFTIMQFFGTYECTLLDGLMEIPKIPKIPKNVRDKKVLSRRKLVKKSSGSVG